MEEPGGGRRDYASESADVAWLCRRIRWLSATKGFEVGAERELLLALGRCWHRRFCSALRNQVAPP